MEQETTQGSMAGIEEITEKPIKPPPPDPLTIVQTHLNKISENIRENTVALVEMGVILRKFEGAFEQLIKERTNNG